MFGTEISILEGLSVTALGMGVTFIVLYFLSLLINLMKVIFFKPPSPDFTQEILPQPIAEQAVATTSGSDVRPVQDSAGELVAAITAALALTLGLEPRSIFIRKITEVKSSQTQNPELIAAISAAIALTIDAPAHSFTIKNIAECDNISFNTSRWNDFNKMAQFDSRL